MNSLNITDFKIMGRDFYPMLAFQETYHSGAFEDLYKRSLAEIESNTSASQSYVFISKEHQQSGDINYRVAIDLPSTAPFDQINSLHYATIQNSVITAINKEAGSGTSASYFNARAERAGLVALLGILQEIVAGTFIIDNEASLTAAGFAKIPFATAPFMLESDPCASPVLENAMYDYACLKVPGTDVYLRDNAQEAYNPDTFSPAVVFTSNTMDAVATRFKEAESSYETISDAFILWLHVEIKDGIAEVYYKTRSNLSEADAQALLDFEYGGHMSEYWSVGGDIEQTENALRDQATSSSRSNNQGSYDCNQLNDCTPTDIDQIKKWRAYCCFRIEGNTPDAMLAGMTAGAVDGVWETLLFLYQAGSGLKKALDHTPFTVGWFIDAYEKVRMEGSLYKGLQSKLADDAVFWGEIYEFVKNISTYKDKIWTAIKQSITGFFNDLSIQTGLFTTGYSVGKIIFEVVLNYLTGGSKLIGSVTKGAVEFFKGLAKGSIHYIDDKFLGFYGKSLDQFNKFRAKIYSYGIFEGKVQLRKRTGGSYELMDLDGKNEYRVGANNIVANSKNIDNVQITKSGIEGIRQHLTTDYFTEGTGKIYKRNNAMIERLEKIEKGEIEVTNTDLYFYTHELRERELMGGKYTDEAYYKGHSQAAKEYGILAKNEESTFYTAEALAFGYEQ